MIASISGEVEGFIGAVGAVALCLFGIVFAVQNARRTVHYSIFHTRFYRAEIVSVDTFSTSVYIKWRARESTVYSVLVRWTDKNGEEQTEVIQTQNRLLGFRCRHSKSIRIAEVTDRKRHRNVPESEAPVPMIFSPDKDGFMRHTGGNAPDSGTRFSLMHLFKSYFGVRDDEPIVQPIEEHEVMFAAQWRGQKLWSFLYMLLLPIVLLLAVLLIAFVLVPIIHALGYDDLDAFFLHFRGR